MNEQIHNFNHYPYPEPSNHIVLDPTPKDQAIYVPSVSPSYAIFVHAQKWRRSLPKGIGSADLNFLDPANKLFRISHVMSSAGQALKQKRKCIITTRDRAHTIMIGDSGGYQIARNPNLVKDNKDRMNILRWLETHADVAMTLDIPTGPLLSGGYFYTSFQECLDATEYNLKFFTKHRTNRHVRLLNVLQGNDQDQADKWYNVVKAYSFEGWAFAGKLRHDMYQLCRRLIIMYREGQIQDKSWIHVLGTNELETAVLLTALQRSINHHMNPNLRISYDTSSPFRNLAWGKVYGIPNFDRKRMTMPTHPTPRGKSYVNSAVRWPWPSPLGDHMVMGDLCVASAPNQEHCLDIQSNMYMAHHNLTALCFGVALANRFFDTYNLGSPHPIASIAGEAVAAIDDVIRNASLETLNKYHSLFVKLRHGVANYADDDQRDL